MFKRLFGNAGKRQPRKEPAETITAHDEDGNAVQIPAAEWLKLLEYNIRQAWDNPDELYRLIISAVDDGYAGGVDVTSQRLLAIDPVPERAYTTRAIVLMNLKRWDDAEAVLDEAMTKLGRSGILLTNLAKVYAEHGDDAKADTTLWEALQADPNQDNGMGWWLALQRDRGGDRGYLEGLDKACTLPGSWLPQLWKARARLEAGDVAGAQDLYHAAFSVESIQPRMNTALTMVSGPLGQAGQLQFMVDLVAPRYDMYRHHPHIGLNLLQAYVSLGDIVSARELLTSMRREQGIDAICKNELDDFDARIADAEAG